MREKETLFQRAIADTGLLWGGAEDVKGSFLLEHRGNEK
jgi:hypothetical protein